MSLSPYPKYKPSGVEWLGDVPTHWEVLSLRRRYRVINGGTPSSAKDTYWDADIHWITPEDLGKNNSKRIAETRRTLSLEGLMNCGAQLVPADSVVLSTRAPIGHVAVTDMESCTNQGCRTLVPKGKDTCADYLYYALVSSNIVLESLGKGTTFLELSADVLSSYVVPCPSYDEQRAIAAFLDRETEKIDALVAKKQILIERLKEERTALITHTVTRGLPPEAACAAGLEPHPKLKSSGVEWLGEVPAHWGVKRLRFILSTPLKYGANEIAELEDLNMPRYVRITDIEENDSLRDETYKSLPEEIASEYLLREGDILFARSGATAGKTFLYKSNWGRCAYAGYLIRGRLDTRKVVPKFIRYFTASSNYWQWIELTFIQSTIQNVSAERYANLCIPLAPLNEQNIIAAFLDRQTEKIDTLVTKIETAIERLQEYRSALITAAVTGKIDVREDRERKLINKSIESTERDEFLTSIDKKIIDIISSARDKNFSDKDFLDDYNILNFYRNVSNFVGLRSLFPNSFSDDGIDLQNLKREHREWMQINEIKELFERSIRYDRGRHFKKYVEAAKKSLSSKCLEPNCQKKAIGSHLISQKYLKFISCKDNKVREIGLFTDPKKMADNFESKIRKNPFILIERILNPESNQFKDLEESSEKFGDAIREGRSSRLTPIHYASQFYGYCSKHDREIYKCFENNDFDPDNRQHLNLLLKRTFDYLYRYIDETCKLRPQELLDATKNSENYSLYIKSIFATRQAFDNLEKASDNFFHFAYTVKSEKPPIIACSRDLSLHGSITEKVSEGNEIKKKVLNLCGPIFLNIFPIKETEILICLSFLHSLYFFLFINQSQSEDTVLEDLRSAILSGNQKRINKELSKLILDRTDTLYLREEFYQTLMRKGFKENLSDFMPTDELNFLNY